MLTEEDERMLREGLNRNEFIQVERFSISENFVREREKLVIYAFVNF